MELSFETLELRDICENSAYGANKYGAEESKSLRARLADLRAADAVSGLIPDYLTLEKNGVRIQVSSSLFIHANVNHKKQPRTPSGETDWTRVTRLKIMEIS